MVDYLENITGYLFSQSWQLIILIMIIAAVTWLLKNRSAHVRYLLWLIVIGKCLIPPLFTVPLAILPQEESVVQNLSSETAESAMLFDASTVIEAESAKIPMTSTEIRPIRSLENKTTQPKVKKFAMPSVGQVAGAIWIIGIVVFSLVAITKVLKSNLQLKKLRKPLPDKLQVSIKELFSEFKIKVFPKVWLLDGVGQPFVWGILRGSIYLPTDYLKIEKVSQRKDILGHEVCHILRLDAIFNSLQVIAQAIFWFHPLVWWANQKIRQEREKCCDEKAVAHLGIKAKEYSTAIVKALISEHRSNRPVPSLAVVGPAKDIEERIKTMLRPGKKFYRRPSIIVLTIVLLLALVMVPIGCVLTNKSKTKTASNQEKRFSSLYEAAKAEDLPEVKRLISEGADLNAFDKEDNMTPLGVAAKYGRTEIVKVLLESGANADIGESAGDSPLYLAIISYFADTANLLIAAGADVNLSRSDDTPLLEAIWLEQPDIVKALIDAGVNIKLTSGDGWLPLQQAVQQCNPDIVKLLINADDNISDLNRAALKGDLSKLNTLLGKGADLNKKDEFGFTPIEYALAGGQSEAAKFLIEHGVNINITGYLRRSLLHLAAKANLYDVVQILIEKGIPVDTTNSLGGNALYEASYYGHKEIVELLISKGASLESKDRSGRTPLIRAITNGHTDIVELLIDKGADVNASGFPGTPLYLANAIGEKEIVNLLRQHGAKITLVEAVTLGDINEAKNLISQGADINVRNAQGMNILNLAAQKGYKEIVELLIDKEADLNVKNKKITTALFSATRYAQKEVTELLINKGADANAKTNNGSTSLHYAVDVARKDIVELLIAAGADVNVSDNSGFTPLYIAQQDGYTEIAELLRKNGAQEISPPLRGAIDYGDIEQVKLLISQGADIDSADNSGRTLLHVVCQKANKEIAELLIENGANVNAKASGWTPLHYVARDGHKDIVELLIAKGAMVNVINGPGSSPLDLAMTNNHTEIVEILKKNGGKRGLIAVITSGDINEVKRIISEGIDTNTKNRAFEQACSVGNIDIMELLIENGAEVNNTTSVSLLLGRNPLNSAITNGNFEIVEFLIEHGVDLNTQNNQGQTSLDLAEENGQTKIVELLQQNGAKKGSPNLLGAVNSGDIEQVKLLISQGADVNAKNNRGQTPLHLACQRGNKEIAKLLIDNGADIDIQNNNHQTPLHIACQRGNKEIVDLLIENKANIGHTPDERYGSTALHIAAVSGHKEIVELLIDKGADIEAKNSDGSSPLNNTSGYGSIYNRDPQGQHEIIELLIDKGANIETRSYWDCTPLYVAITEDRPKMAEVLLKHGAKLNVISKFLGTITHCAMRVNLPEMVRWSIEKGVDIPLLHQAAYFGDIDKVKSLISNGADVKQKDVADFTALHCAALGQNPEIAQLLIDNGADIEARNCGNRTALYDVCNLGYLGMVKLLVENGADVNITANHRDEFSSDGIANDWTPLNVAAHAGHAEVVEYLLTNRADIQAKCTRLGHEGLTALHLAARNGRLNVVEVLLANGADINEKTDKGSTPLSLAQAQAQYLPASEAQNYNTIVQLLREHGAEE